MSNAKEINEIRQFISSISAIRFRETLKAIDLMKEKINQTYEKNSKVELYSAISSDLSLIQNYKEARIYCIKSIINSGKDPIYISQLSNIYVDRKEFFKSYLIAKIAFSKALKDGNFVRQMSFNLVRSTLLCKRYEETRNLIKFVIDYAPSKGSIDVGYERDFISELKKIPVLQDIAEKYECIALG